MKGKTWYRVRLEGGRFLGCERPEEGLRPVLEPLAYCFADPREAVEALLESGLVGGVEVARSLRRGA